MYKPVVKIGLQLLIEKHIDLLKDKRLGVVTNHTGVTPNFNHIIDILYFKLHLNVKIIFAPEHGVRGDIPEGALVKSCFDERTKLPIISLYGTTHSPPKDILKKARGDCI